jgi:hypothetical protein
MAIRLFKKPDLEPKEIKANLEAEIIRLEEILVGKRKELRFFEAPVAEKLNIIAQREQDLRDEKEAVEEIVDLMGERKLALEKKEKELLLKEQIQNDLFRRT